MNTQLRSSLTVFVLFLSIYVTGQNSDSQDRHDFLTSTYDMYASPQGLNAAPGDVGYYNMSSGMGLSPDQSDPIIAAGFNPVQIFDLSAVELSGIDVLMVDNPDNGSYGAEYIAQLAVIENAVNNGMVLVIHDRFVTDGTTILPGDGASINIFRDFSDDEDIDIVDNTTCVTSGLDNTSLDGGGSSNHGYAEESSLPAGAINILSRSNPTESVLFSYPHGGGAVIYSTIPLDYYLSGGGDNPPSDNFTMIYAPNVVTYAASDLDCIAAAIPTMSQWGMMALFLLTAIFGIVMIRQRKPGLA